MLIFHKDVMLLNGFKAKRAFEASMAVFLIPCLELVATFSKCFKKTAIDNPKQTLQNISE